MDSARIGNEIAALLLATCLVIGGLCSCTPTSGRTSSDAAGSASASAASLAASDLAAPSQGSSDNPAASVSAEASRDIAPLSPVAYPTGWLVAPWEGIPACTPVSILALPDLPVSAHRDGTAVKPEEQRGLDAALPDTAGSDAIVLFDGAAQAVPADYLLVNLPDIAPQAVYDIVYSYASTSRCADRDIPGVTGEQLPGYCSGMQENAYWNAPRFVVPCAYRTALKLLGVCDELAASGYRLLVYDAYRPMTAQFYLSNAFQSAFYADPVMQGSLGSWSLNWYVADGASGHNFGTDLDVGVCDAAGTPIEMPSAFDAFDETGHLTSYPVDSWGITPDAYRPEVQENEACMALHDAFVRAGFTELASEWWHFADGETESRIRWIAGNGGLDFEATLL